MSTLMAPPTKDELAKAKTNLMAPPTAAELRSFGAAPKQTPKPGAGEAALRGAAQSASFGLIDEFTAGVGAAGDFAQAKLGQRGDISLGDAYRTRRDVIRKADATAAEAQPLAYGGGALAGGVASVVGGGALLQAARARAIPAATGPIFKTAAQRVGAAAAGGGVAGAGASEADLTRGKVGEFAGDVAKGAAVGGVLQAGVDKAVGPLSRAAQAGLGRASDKLKDVAEKRAFKAAVGNQAKVYDEAVAQGSVNRRGRELMDEGVVTFGASAAKIADRSKEKLKEVGAKFDPLWEELDAAAPAAVSGANMAGAIRKYRDQIAGGGNKGLVKQLDDAADELEAAGSISFKEAQKQKNSWNFYEGQPSAAQKKVHNKVKSIIGDEMETAVGAVGGQDKLAAYLDIKNKYGTFVGAAKSATTLANRQDKNATFGLLDLVSASAGGVPAMLANHLVRRRGSSAVAVTADSLADALKSSPEALGKYTPIIQDAARRGGQALTTTHFTLMESQPDYRALFGGDPKKDAIRRRMGKE